MPTLIPEDVAREAVGLILSDLGDRKGLRQEWDSIDDDIKAEIIATWQECIVACIRGSGEATADGE